MLMIIRRRGTTIIIPEMIILIWPCSSSITRRWVTALGRWPLKRNSIMRARNRIRCVSICCSLFGLMQSGQKSNVALFYVILAIWILASERSLKHRHISPRIQFQAIICIFGWRNRSMRRTRIINCMPSLSIISPSSILPVVCNDRIWSAISRGLMHVMMVDRIFGGYFPWVSVSNLVRRIRIAEFWNPNLLLQFSISGRLLKMGMAAFRIVRTIQCIIGHSHYRRRQEEWCFVWVFELRGFFLIVVHCLDLL